jgi:hypothetical protein
MLTSLVAFVFAAGMVQTAPAPAPAPAPQPAAPAAPAARAPRTPSPAGAEVYIIEPADGATVAKDFTVKFGLRGMGVAPAGINVEKTGHHHLLVDVETLPPLDAPLPNDAQHRHFGGGQTEVALTLPPGKHTLQLLFADYLHVPHDPPVLSKKITVTVSP